MGQRLKDVERLTVPDRRLGQNLRQFRPDETFRVNG
jgi:hypothetical protein